LFLGITKLDKGGNGVEQKPVSKDTKNAGYKEKRQATRDNLL